MPCSSSRVANASDPPGHGDPEVHRRGVAGDPQAAAPQCAADDARACAAYRARVSSTCRSSFQAAIDARWTNSCGAVPTVGRNARSAATSVGIAGGEARPVAGHRGALAERVEDDDVAAVGELERRGRRRLEPELAVGLVGGEQEAVLAGELGEPLVELERCDRRGRVVRIVDPEDGELVPAVEARRGRAGSRSPRAAAGRRPRRPRRARRARRPGTPDPGRHEAPLADDRLRQAEDRLLAAERRDDLPLRVERRRRTGARPSPRSPRAAPAAPARAGSATHGRAPRRARP